MDNQKDQFGTTPDQTNASRINNANCTIPTSAASGTSSKSASSPIASDAASTPASQSAASMPNAQAQDTANAGINRQGEDQQTNDREGTIIDAALNSGKKWIADSGVLNSVNQLPQSLKDLGNRAVDRISGLSTTQKVVGGAILAAGLGWLATRKGNSLSSDSSAYNYGRQRDAGYGRQNYGYQAPDATTSSSQSVGTSGRSDSGSPYGNSGSRFGSSGRYNADARSAGNTGLQSGSDRDDSGTGPGGASAARADHSTQSAGTDYSAKHADYRSIE